MLKYVFNGRAVRYGLRCGLEYDCRRWCRRFSASDNFGGSFRNSDAVIDRQAAMDAFSDRQEGRPVGMVGFGTTRALDDGRHADDNTEKQNPEAKQPTHDPRCCLQLKRNQHTRYVNQDNPPQQPAATANLLQSCQDVSGFNRAVFGQRMPLRGDGSSGLIKCTTCCHTGKQLYAGKSFCYGRSST
jgi:hypothetical protein